MPDTFSAITLPKAIRSLFEANNYLVEGPVQIHGAEIDLVARSLSDPFAERIYIEATIEYVDNDKYGKDVGKLAMVREQEPGCQTLIISSSGFSLPVIERAKNSRILTFTWDALFRKFERFDSYVTAIGGAKALEALNTVYEEPLFRDSLGEDGATDFLTRWRDHALGRPGWIVVTGEYGTGKTALTKVLQYRWLKDYKSNPSLPIVFRIELRDFARQFDADGLLHRFLDAHQLGHVPIQFVHSLLQRGRVVLLLDGYDEMAQYLHARERRACLEALAELSAGGARGILTSRPNYFTEAEELQVFEVLYRSLSTSGYSNLASAAELLERERRVDQLLAQFLDRFERTLQDLSEPQTLALVGRVLANDAVGRDVVMSLLRRVFRTVGRGDAISLSGKPVIVSYLLEVVEGLKNATETKQNVPLNEWDIYRLVIDQLMLRDLQRSPEISPVERRDFLTRLALALSKRDVPTASDEIMKNIIARQFRTQLARLHADSRAAQLERYFADLRSSATLTRDVGQTGGGWKFSHNSLREFLIAEYLLARIDLGDLSIDDVPVSDAMRTFAASKGPGEMTRLLPVLGRHLKGSSGSEHAKGAIFSLLWEGLVALFSADDPRSECLRALTGKPISLSNIAVSRVVFSREDGPSDLKNASFARSSLHAVDFDGADLTSADFTHAILEGVRFAGAVLERAKFYRALIVDCDFTDAKLTGADFRDIDNTAVSIFIASSGKPILPKQLLTGNAAIGYLKFCGAHTPEVPEIFVVRHHPRFAIVEKILENLAEQSIRQRRGLAQRGAARQDVTFARNFVAALEDGGLIRTPRNRKDQVEVTEAGRAAFSKFIQEGVVPPEVLRFLRPRS